VEHVTTGATPRNHGPAVIALAANQNALAGGQLGREMLVPIGEVQVADVVQGGAAEGDAHGIYLDDPLRD